MDNLGKQSLDGCRTAIMAALRKSTGLESSPINKRKRKPTLSYARLSVVTLCLGSFLVSQTFADQGCDCGEASTCSSCSACGSTPRIRGLGNGLLDYLDKATGNFEFNLFRLRSSNGSCDSTCSEACDGFQGGLGCSTEACGCGKSQNSMSRNFSETMSSVESHPALRADRLELDRYQAPRSAELSPIPMPIPDPVASPPSNPSHPVPVNKKQGNPFLDEARSTRSTFKTPEVVVKSFKKTSVKAAPHSRYQAPPTSILAKKLENDTGDHVVTAGAIENDSKSKVQFAK